MQHFPFLELTGGPFDLGRGHGERFRDSVRVQLTETLHAAQGAGLARDDALAWAEAQLPSIAALNGAWIEELRGLAAGAEITLAEAAALQVRPGSGAMPQGCTAFAVCGDAAADGRPLCGQNRDLVPAYRPRMCVLLLRPRGGTPLLMHSVPGELGGVGLNGHGVCVLANSLWARSGRTWMAPPLLRRAVLECRSADEAARRVAAMNGPAVGNYLVADAAGEVRNLEVLPEAQAVIAKSAGVLAHANNCLDAGLRACEAAATAAPGSARRQAWLQSRLEEGSGRWTVDKLKKLLSDHRPAPEAVCRHAEGEQRWETAAAVIAEPATRRLHLSYGPPCQGRFSTWTVAD